MVGFSQGTALSRPPVEAAVNNMSAAGSESTDGDPGLNDIGAFTERFYTVVEARDPDRGGFDNWVADRTLYKT